MIFFIKKVLRLMGAKIEEQQIEWREEGCGFHVIPFKMLGANFQCGV
jgi:hypothetical protein